jgi:predicted acetyltransferase
MNDRSTLEVKIEFEVWLVIVAINARSYESMGSVVLDSRFLKWLSKQVGYVELRHCVDDFEYAGFSDPVGAVYNRELVRRWKVDPVVVLVVQS